MRHFQTVKGCGLVDSCLELAWRWLCTRTDSWQPNERTGDNAPIEARFNYIFRKLDFNLVYISSRTKKCDAEKPDLLVSIIKIVMCIAFRKTNGNVIYSLPLSSNMKSPAAACQSVCQRPTNPGSARLE
jgi:hypothetical protein